MFIIEKLVFIQHLTHRALGTYNLWKMLPNGILGKKTTNLENCHISIDMFARKQNFDLIRSALDSLDLEVLLYISNFTQDLKIKVLRSFHLPLVKTCEVTLLARTDY